MTREWLDFKIIMLSHFLNMQWSSFCSEFHCPINCRVLTLHTSDMTFTKRELIISFNKIVCLPFVGGLGCPSFPPVSHPLNFTRNNFYILNPLQISPTAVDMYSSELRVPKRTHSFSDLCSSQLHAWIFLDKSICLM